MQAQSSDQGRIIKGKFIDKDGEGLSSQNITISGTIGGTTSDINGEFCLPVPSNEIVYNSDKIYLSLIVSTTPLVLNSLMNFLLVFS